MKKFCPNCGSDEVDLAAGGITGMWMCRDCGYTGIFPEKPLVMTEESIEDNKIRKGKAKTMKNMKGRKK